MAAAAPTWSEAETDILTAMRAEGKTFQQIQMRLAAEGFHRSFDMVRRKAWRAKNHASSKKLTRWTGEMVSVLLAMRGASSVDVAEAINTKFCTTLTRSSIINARKRYDPRDEYQESEPEMLALEPVVQVRRQPAVKYLEPFVSITLRVPDPNIGRRLG